MNGAKNRIPKGIKLLRADLAPSIFMTSSWNYLKKEIIQQQTMSNTLQHKTVRWIEYDSVHDSAGYTLHFILGDLLLTVIYILNLMPPVSVNTNPYILLTSDVPSMRHSRPWGLRSKCAHYFLPIMGY